MFNIQKDLSEENQQFVFYMESYIENERLYKTDIDIFLQEHLIINYSSKNYIKDFLMFLACRDGDIIKIRYLYSIGAIINKNCVREGIKHYNYEINNFLLDQVYIYPFF